MRPNAPGPTFLYAGASPRLRKALNDSWNAILHVHKPARSVSELRHRRQHLLKVTEALAAALAEEMTS
jgi:hypothetical protein